MLRFGKRSRIADSCLAENRELGYYLDPLIGARQRWFGLRRATLFSRGAVRNTPNLLTTSHLEPTQPSAVIHLDHSDIPTCCASLVCPPIVRGGKCVSVCSLHLYWLQGCSV